MILKSMSSGIIYNKNDTFTIYPQNFRRLMLVHLSLFLFRIFLGLILTYLDLRVAILFTVAYSAGSSIINRTAYGCSLPYTYFEEIYYSIFTIFIFIIFSVTLASF